MDGSEKPQADGKPCINFAFDSFRGGYCLLAIYQKFTDRGLGSTPKGGSHA
jgi:hypothetical protein